MGNEDLTNCIPWYCSLALNVKIYKMARRKEEFVERINLEKEMVESNENICL